MSIACYILTAAPGYVGRLNIAEVMKTSAELNARFQYFFTVTSNITIFKLLFLL